MTTYSADIFEVLSGVGLSENEAQVYLATLELGPSTVLDIARKSGVKRPTCYVLLDELTFRGFASRTEGKKAARYSVLSPKQLLQRVATRQDRLQKYLGDLDALASKSGQKPEVRLLEGVEGVKEAYRSTLDQPKGSEMLLYGTADVLVILEGWIHDYMADRVKHRVSVKAILPDTPSNRSVQPRDKVELRETRFLPTASFDPRLELILIGDTVMFIAHSEHEPFATIITNSTIADLQRQQFEYLWRAAK
ncbi:MAG: helix-turn-helix domain-containing protein [Patescibacteria group bacterium]